MQPRADWERAVFDAAAHFLTIDMARSFTDPERRARWPTFPQALQFARKSDRVCIYAVTPAERSTILERAAWDRWEERWNQRSPS